MKASTKARLTDPKLLAAREGHMRRLAAMYGGERLQQPFVLCGYCGKGQADPYIDPEQWVVEALDDLAANGDKLLDAVVFRPLAIEFDPYGVHFVDHIFGAEVFQVDSGMGAEYGWQAHYLDQPVGRLEPPDLDNDPTWALVRRVTEAFVSAEVTVPLFGLPVIASPLNIAVNLYGENILLAMVADPEAAHHDLGVINDLLCRLHRWYQAHLPAAQLQPTVAAGRTQPPGFGQLCGCTTQLVSARQYGHFIAPLDEALLSVYAGGGMIHLCGAHTQHIPIWRSMKALRAVQMNDRAIDDLATYYADLRDDQMLYCNPYDQMSVAQILEITRGHRTVICADYTGPFESV